MKELYFQFTMANWMKNSSENSEYDGFFLSSLFWLIWFLEMILILILILIDIVTWLTFLHRFFHHK
jgi:hypothetical protein